jgi:hypothetical protein
MPKGLDKKIGNYERTDCKHIDDARVFHVFRKAGGLGATDRGRGKLLMLKTSRIWMKKDKTYGRYIG